MDGQFEDGKKKSEENETLEEQIEKEVGVEGKGCKSLPKRVHAQVQTDFSSSAIRRGNMLHH